MPLPNHLSQGDLQRRLNDFGPGGITLLPNGGLLLTGGGLTQAAGSYCALEPSAGVMSPVTGAHGS